MRTLLAIFVAICSAVWLYSSIYIYNCDTNIHCAYKSIGGEREIIIMISGAFVLGFLFGNIISGYKKKKYIKRSKLDKIQGSYTKSKKYGVHKVVDKSNINQNNNNIDIKKSREIDINKSSEIIDDINNNDGIFGNLFKENNSSKIKVDNNNSDKKSEWTEEVPEVNSEEGIESNSNFDWNTAPDVKKQDFKIIEDRGENGFKIKDDIQKKDDSILKIHQKNVADDLTKIEGIGPKIQDLLNAKNLYTFDDISKTDPYKISDILALAGTRFQMHNPKTWPKQAEIANRGDWDELKKYQDILKGGKE